MATPPELPSPTASHAVLHDEGFRVPEPSDSTAVGSAQRAMARWSNGPAHAARRSIAVDAIAALDPADLRTVARAFTEPLLPTAKDLVEIARLVTVTVLAGALGFREPLLAAHHQRIVSAAITPEDGRPAAEEDTVAASLAWLLEAAGAKSFEVAANRVGLLHQCLDATAGLVGLAVVGWLALGPPDRAALGPDVVAALVARTGVDDPPVVQTVRIGPDGERVVVRLDGAAGEPALTFGAGAHACPGAQAASALAEGVLDAVLRSDVLDRLETLRPAYERRSNLRIPVLRLRPASSSEPRA